LLQDVDELRERLGGGGERLDLLVCDLGKVPAPSRDHEHADDAGRDGVAGAAPDRLLGLQLRALLRRGHRPLRCRQARLREAGVSVTGELLHSYGAHTDVAAQILHRATDLGAGAIVLGPETRHAAAGPTSRGFALFAARTPRRSF